MCIRVITNGFLVRAVGGISVGRIRDYKKKFARGDHSRFALGDYLLTIVSKTPKECVQWEELQWDESEITKKSLLVAIIRGLLVVIIY